jgi:hypothetical protein
MPALHDMTATAAISWMPSAAREALSLFGALMLVTAVSTLLIVFLRKRRLAHSSRHHHSSQVAQRDSFESVKQHSSAPGRQKRHRYRLRRPRNPTLAETGGLPPLRQDNPPPPPSPN